MRLEALLRPRSVAIVGASDNVGPGFNAWNALRYVGYTGEIHLVNPNKPELFGRPTYKSLVEIPGPIDAAFVSVQAGSVLEIVRQAAAKRAGGLAILSSESARPARRVHAPSVISWLSRKSTISRFAARTASAY